MTLYERARSEVEDLHRCVLAWCAGEVTDSEAAWARIEASWATGFRLLDTDGRPVEGSVCLNRLQARFREPADERLRALWVEGFTGTQVAPDLFLALYEEWERRPDGAEVGRACSALLRAAGDGPYGLQWIHAQRAWLPADARPSLPPPDAAPAPAAAEDDAEAEPACVPPSGDDVPFLFRQHHHTEAPTPEVARAATKAAHETPTQAIRAFFGDAAAQQALGQGPPPDYEATDPDCWLRVLREGGNQAVIRAGLAALALLLEPWERWFPHEPAPRQVARALERWLAGDEAAQAEAQGLVDAAEQAGQRAYAQAEQYLPADTAQADFEELLERTNAAQAAARLAAAAGGSAIGAAVKLAPVLSAFSEPRRRELRARVLAAFGG